MQRVTAPGGQEWKVGRQWLPRRPRFRDELIDIPNMGDAGGPDFDVGGFLLVIAAIAVLFVVLVVVFPVVVLALELILLLVLLVAGVAARVVFRKPWHVLARSDAAAYRWPVKGWRASGRRVEEVAASLGGGTIPEGAELLKR